MLKTVIQGNKLNSISVVGITDFGNSTLNGEIVKDNTKTIGSQVKVLDETNKIKFKIDSDMIFVGCCKKVVCNFEPGLKEKLVEGVDLEKLCDAFKEEGIKKENLKLSAVVKSLNNCDIVDTNKGFFNNLNGVLIIKDGDSTKEENKVNNDENPKDFSDAIFVVIDGIKEGHINPIFLKKNFTVKFDNEGNNDKKFDKNEILLQIQDTLNNELKDKVDIKVSDITNIISNFNSGKPNDTIIKNAFDTLDNISIVGVKNEVNGTLGFTGNFIVGFVGFIYFLLDMDKIRNFIKNCLKTINVRSYEYVRLMDVEITNYLKGLEIFMVIQFFEYSFLFFIIGHPNWLILGLLACITTVIPYFGGLITNIIAIILASVVSLPLVIMTTIICLIFPQLDVRVDSHDGIPHLLRFSGRQVQFYAVFTGITGCGTDTWYTCYFRAVFRIVVFLRNAAFGADFGDDILCLRALHGNLSVLG